MTIDENIAKAKELAGLARTTFPDESMKQEQLADWLEELKWFREQREKFSNQGISICILTYNVLFYNKLALQQIRSLTKHAQYEILFYDNGSTDGSVQWLEQQPDVIVARNHNGNHLRHGDALNYLVRNMARYPICCALCSDAFPTSVEWTVPAMYLNEETFLTGVERGYGRIVDNYVCPSYLFGWTDWLKNNDFTDNWPHWDTGEQLTRNCLKEGKKVKFWKATDSTFDGRFTPKRCDYSGLVWHVWWGGRSQTVPHIVNREMEPDYQEFMLSYLREKHNLDF